MGPRREPYFGVTLSVLGTIIVLSILWCETEGRGNRVRVDSSGTKAQVCKSRECIDAANVIYANRDTSVEPCNNFYEFACGGWVKTHPVPENSTSWDQFLEASAVKNERLKEILEKVDVSDDTQSIKDARKFYRACLDVDKQTERNMQILQDRLAVWGGWPMATEDWKEEMFDWKKLLVNLGRTNNASPLLEISVGADRRNTSQNVISIDQGEVSCTHLLFKSKMEAARARMKGAARIIAKAANQTVSEKRLSHEVRQVMMLQTRLCMAMSSSSDREDNFNLYNAKTVAEVQNMTDGAEPLKEDSKINWVDMLKDVFEGADVNVDENQTVIVHEPDYLLEVIRVVDKMPPRALGLEPTRLQCIL